MAEKVNTILKAFQLIERKPVSCIEKITLVLDFFIKQMKEHNAALPKLLDNFINYAAVTRESFEDMEMYTDVREEITIAFTRMIENGKEDGSIRKDVNASQTIATIISNFSIFTLKLSLRDTTNLIEPELSTEEQLQIMKNIYLEFLKPEKELPEE